LQNRGGLAGDQPSDLDDLPVREFNCVVVDARIAHVHLPKPCDFVMDSRFSEEAESALVLDLMVERQLRARKQADCHLGFADSGEAAGERSFKIR
jgi:hypothetical protein